MMRAMAAMMPATHKDAMHANSGRDTVRNSFTMTVRSGGTLPPSKQKRVKEKSSKMELDEKLVCV